MRKRISSALLCILAATALAPAALAATAPLRYAAWVPFWKELRGAHDVALHLDSFGEVSPFSYEVRANGSLRDRLKLAEGFWPAWLDAARELRVKIIPTVAWLDGDAIHALLSKGILRRRHENAIASLVVANRFDGVDIDYENKNADDQKYFSLFLEGLALRLHPRGKILSCTIEPRTPPASQFAVIPADLAYANNYGVIGRYCDEVRLMAYDQGNVDLLLNAAKGGGTFYMPVADPAWAEKVIQEALKEIPARKLMLGVPTYGYIYEVASSTGGATYKRLASVTYAQAEKLAAELGIAPVRNSAGELDFAYATSTSFSVPPALTYPVAASSTPPLFPAPAVTRFVTWSDAGAIAQKIALAKKYRLRGVIFFKMDGEADPALWGAMQ